MTNEISLKSPVKIQDNSAERVAFDLMNMIAYSENATRNNEDSRTYYLTLYRHCLMAVKSDKAITAILTED